MVIAVIGGTGSQGRGLASRWATAGLPVIIGSRDRQRAADTVSAIVGERGPLTIEAASNGDAIAAADTVVLAVPCQSAADIVQQHRGLFKPGTVVVDVTVPVAFEGGQPRFTESAVSCAEHLVHVIPPGVRLAGAFKTLPAKLLQGTASLDCDEFVCGDSDEARARAAELVRAIPGVRPLDVGALDAARAIERMTFLAILLNKRYKSRGARFRVVGV